MATATIENIKDQNQLHLDHVLSTQPELGPKIPDGGYGWIILVASSFFRILISSLPVGYGTILLFAQLESGISTHPKLWDLKIMYAPLFFICFWTLTEPWCRKIALDSTWPRLVCVAATCLASAGLLILWIAFNNRKMAILYVAAGSVSGFGASLILTQIDVIISQYFYTRIQMVRTLLNICTALGFIFTPIALGYNILKIGILPCISWYQAIILQGIVISIVIKKPEYLKLHRSRYNLLRGIADEEEDIFTKSTELQSPRVSSQNSSKIQSTTTPSSKNHTQSLQEELQQAGWTRFNDDTNKLPTDKHSQLNVAFAVEFRNAVSKISQFEDNYVEAPQPLFTESQLNNNVSYSYESSPVEMENPVVFMPIQDTSKRKWMPDVTCFKEPTFYKTLFLVITLKYSIFIFWILFPSNLYLRVDHLKVHHATTLVGCISIVGLIFSIITMWIKKNSKLSISMVVLLCWSSAIGCVILSSSRTEVLTVFAAILLVININSLQILALPSMKFNFAGEHSSGYCFLSTISAVCIISLLGIDISYKNCFRLLAVLHFLAGSLYLTSIIYKKIKTLMHC